MNIGYACLALAVPGSEFKSCILKNADKKRLLALIEHNLNSLETLLEYNISNSILLFRISSDLIPFGSNLAENLPWREIFSEKLLKIGNKIRHSRMRVSMHPGQYTVLNSPNKGVKDRAVADLCYHTAFLNSLGLGDEHKIILHLGGVYGDKKQAKRRFISSYKELDPSIQKRLVVENDNTLYNIGDVLDTATDAEIPVVYDNLHNSVNPTDRTRTDFDWIRLCSTTWKREDGYQKIHYSQQNPDKKPGAHSQSIKIKPFLRFYEQLSGMDIDIMLEVKDKNISALKCINCVINKGTPALEADWARYKYCILERSPENYQDIRKLLKNKGIYAAGEMYNLIEEAFDLPIIAGNGVNTTQHVWGYFKNHASLVEKRRLLALLQKYTLGEKEICTVKNYLFQLAKKYRQDYLLKGYYFYK